MGGNMPKPKLAYAIDDALSTDDNLAALSAAAASIDANLAAVLEPQLTAWASGEVVDTNALWNALYAATAADSAEEQA